jgi:hypothetical protein
MSTYIRIIGLAITVLGSEVCRRGDCSCIWGDWESVVPLLVLAPDHTHCQAVDPPPPLISECGSPTHILGQWPALTVQDNSSPPLTQERVSCVGELSCWVSPPPVEDWTKTGSYGGPTDCHSWRMWASPLSPGVQVAGHTQRVASEPAVPV